MTHVDGATIWPVDLWLHQYVTSKGMEQTFTPETAIRAAGAEYGLDLRDVRFVAVDPTRGNTPQSFLGDDDIVVAIANPSPDMRHWGYGLSPCETSIIASLVYLSGIGYVFDFFENTFSEMVGVLSGDDYGDEDAQVIVDHLRTHHRGPGKHFHTPVITVRQADDLKFLPTRSNSAADMQFEQTILDHCPKLICAHYGADVTELNLSPRAAGQGGLSEPGRDQEQQVKRNEGLNGALKFFAEDIFTPIVQRRDPDLIFAWMGLDDEAEKNELELRTKREDYHISIDEARIEEGRAPLNTKWSKAPKWAALAILQAELQQEAAALRAPPGEGENGQGGEGDQKQGVGRGAEEAAKSFGTVEILIEDGRR
jgi:hypothetical protein